MKVQHDLIVLRSLCDGFVLTFDDDGRFLLELYYHEDVKRFVSVDIHRLLDNALSWSRWYQSFR